MSPEGYETFKLVVGDINRFAHETERCTCKLGELGTPWILINRMRYDDEFVNEFVNWLWISRRMDPQDPVSNEMVAELCNHIVEQLT